MKRIEFHKLFKTPGPVILPVIHVLDSTQAMRNVEIALKEGAPGIFLINHDFAYPQFLPIIRDVRRRWPALWLGVNFLAITGLDAFPILGGLSAEGIEVDAYWADDARIDEFNDAGAQREAKLIAATRQGSGWGGLYFGGTCFKKQREVEPQHYAVSARIATQFMDAICTSGVATGQSADPQKTRIFREAIGERVLALASGITPENAAIYAADVDCFMVATGINHPGDFYNIAADRLRELLLICRNQGAI